MENEFRVNSLRMNLCLKWETSGREPSPVVQVTEDGTGASGDGEKNQQNHNTFLTLKAECKTCAVMKEW